MSFLVTDEKIESCYNNHDADGLNNIMENVDSLTVPQRLTRMICESYLADINDQNPFYFNEDESDFVQSYLLSSGPWYRFEYIIYANLCYSLNLRVNKKILRHMCSQYRNFHLGDYSECFVMTFYNLAVSCIDSHDLKGAGVILKYIQPEDIESRDLYVKFHLSVIKLTLRILTHPSDIESVTRLWNLMQAFNYVDSFTSEKITRWIHEMGVQLKSP